MPVSLFVFIYPKRHCEQRNQYADKSQALSDHLSCGTVSHFEVLSSMSILSVSTNILSDIEHSFCINTANFKYGLGSEKLFA